MFKISPAELFENDLLITNGLPVFSLSLSPFHTYRNLINGHMVYAEEAQYKI